MLDGDFFSFVVAARSVGCCYSNRRRLRKGFLFFFDAAKLRKLHSSTRSHLVQPYPSPRTVCCLLPAQAVQTPWGRSIIIVVDVFRGIEGGEIPFEPMCQALVTIAADRSDDNALRTKPFLSRRKQVIHRKHQTSFSSSRSFGAHINSMA